MSRRRPLIPVGLLILLLGVAHERAFSDTPAAGTSRSKLVETTAVPAADAISNLVVTLDSTGKWQADFDYAYTGRDASATIRVELIGSGDETPAIQNLPVAWIRPLVGSHHHHVRIEPVFGMHITSVFVAIYMDAQSTLFSGSQTVRQTIEHPATAGPTNGNRPKTGWDETEDASRLLDLGTDSAITEARHILERVIQKYPRLAQAYVGLARVAGLSTDWSAEGLHQAEGLLDSALALDPSNVDAKILLGFVYVQQKRYPQAKELFERAAAQREIKSAWLWDNWGELLLLEGKPDEAILKYRQALQQEKKPFVDTGRREAYRQLVDILRKRNDLDGMEALYKQQIEDFGPGSCYSAEYSEFLLNVRGDPQAAIDLSRRALNQNCDDARSRAVMGLASYVKWASTEGATSAEALNQARIYVPVGAMTFYRLAGSERTAPALKKLLATGETIDSRDSNGNTALSYAVGRHDVAAIKRLLALGAHANIPAGYGDVPIALQPVMEGNVEIVRILQQAGVDYSSIRFHGATAFDYAEQSGNDALRKALGRKNRAL